jgi:hypothetical protein
LMPTAEKVTSSAGRILSAPSCQIIVSPRDLWRPVSRYQKDQS